MCNRRRRARRRPAVPEVRWLEVLIVVVEGAGETQRVDQRELRGFVWSNQQDRIMRELQRAEEFWEVRFIHGKQVNGVWRDFVLLDGTGAWRGHPEATTDREMYNRLRFFDGNYSQMSSYMHYIYSNTRTQHRSTDVNIKPVILIYTDVRAQHSGMVRSEPGSTELSRSHGGITLGRRDSRFEDFPTDVALIYPEPYDDGATTTAHELGHMVAHLDHSGDETNIMGVAGRQSTRVHSTEAQRRHFYSGRYRNQVYVQTGEIPPSGYSAP